MAMNTDYSMFETPENYSEYIKILSRNFQRHPDKDFFNRELQFYLEEIVIMQARAEILTDLISIAVEKDCEFLNSMALLTEEMTAKKANIIEMSSYICPVSDETLAPFEDFGNKERLAKILSEAFDKLSNLGTSNEFVREFNKYEAGFLYLYKNVDVLQDYFGDKINKYFFLQPENFKKYGEIRKKRYDIALAAIDSAFHENLHK